MFHNNIAYSVFASVDMYLSMNEYGHVWNIRLVVYLRPIDVI